MNTYISNRRGAVIVIAALILPVFLALAGLAVDTANAYMQKNKMQNALDAAAMSAAYLLSSTNPDTETKTAIEKRLNKHFQGSLNGLTSEVSIENYTPTDDNNPAMLLKATSEYKPVFLSIVGIKNFPINVTTRVKREKTNSNHSSHNNPLYDSDLSNSANELLASITGYGMAALSEDDPFLIFSCRTSYFHTKFLSYGGFEFDQTTYDASQEGANVADYQHYLNGLESTLLSPYNNCLNENSEFLSTGSKQPWGWDNAGAVKDYFKNNAYSTATPAPPNLNDLQKAFKDYFDVKKAKATQFSGDGNNLFETAKATPLLYSPNSITVNKIPWNADMNIGATIIAENDFTIKDNGYIFKTDETKPLVICSVNGNITIPANGITYRNIILLAPNGTITLTGTGGSTFSGNMIAKNIILTDQSSNNFMGPDGSGDTSDGSSSGSSSSGGSGGGHGKPIIIE